MRVISDNHARHNQCSGSNRITHLQDQKPDFILLQETWHLGNACNYFSTIHKDYTFVEQSGVDSTCGILKGRPNGGLAILFKTGLAEYINKIPTRYNRVCAVHLKRDATDILIVNA